jgi:hypothetical protein
MKRSGLFLSIAGCLGLAGSLLAADPPAPCPPAPCQPIYVRDCHGKLVPLMPGAPATTFTPGAMPGAPGTPATPTAPAAPGAPPAAAQPPAPQQPGQDLFAQAPTEGTAAPESFSPNMIGDFNSYYFTPKSRSSQSSSSTPSSSPSSSRSSSDIRIPIPGRAAFKIAENESPRAQDRAFLAYSFYNDIARKTDVAGAPDTNYHREVLGFEKSLGEGRGSLGLRLPFVQLNGNPAFEQSLFGDLSVIGKAHLYDGGPDGNLFSLGMVVTIPTSITAFRDDGTSFRSTLFQPFLGYILNVNESLYAHGFTSLTLPTTDDDATIMFNDIGLGYRLYQSNDGGWLTSVTPTLEAHLTTPLSKQGLFATPVGVPDLLIVTGGVHLGLGDRSTLTLGAATPFTGPRVFSYEGIVQLNLRF